MFRLELITQFNIGVLTVNSTNFHCEPKFLFKNVFIPELSMDRLDRARTRPEPENASPNPKVI